MDARLMRVLNFDMNDLQANRLGRLTARQQASLHQTNRASARSLSLLAVLALLLAVVCAALGQWLWAGILALAAVVIGLLAWILHGLRRSVPPRVEMVVGAVELKIARAADGTRHYLLTVGGRRFVVEQSLYEAFVPGLVYCVYYVEGVGILSAEPD
jgi:lysylphosphatidylglycerol synthetase-like protein (DUF2156 family)